jgi:hypothetical protein
MMTTVVNKLTSNYDAYIGRGSRFGNPFKIGEDGNRDEVISLYAYYFEEKLEGEPGFREAVEALRGKKLGCYCAPKRCHGDVIVEYLEGLEDGRIYR